MSLVDTKGMIKLVFLALIAGLLPASSFGALTIFGGKNMSPTQAAYCRQRFADLQNAEAERALELKLANRKKSKILTNEEMTMVWYTPMELGDYEADTRKDEQTGTYRFVRGTFTSGGQDFERDFANLRFEFMPDAEHDAAAYYAIASKNLGTGYLTVQLHSLNSEETLAKKIGQELNLVWNTYLKENTVSLSEIEEFKRLEANLPPQRKLTFVVKETRSGRTLSVMRVYDGSPFPGVYYGDFGQIFDFREVDRRLPIELRYPEINFRDGTQHVFEAGRLAKDADIDLALERQFATLAGHLLGKYGFSGQVPEGYSKGRIYIEITERNLKKFLRTRKNNGYGFTLFKKLPKDGTTSQKYILYSTVSDFITNFWGPTQ
jgi:hypothetical protein